MIRGPILSQGRSGPWPALASRLACIEHGLALVAEALECGGPGPIDALARDAIGGAVLLVVASGSDPGFVGRVLEACDFVERVGPGLMAAVPEGEFSEAPCRVFALGGQDSASQLELLARVPLRSLWVGRVERFRLGGDERMVVHWLSRPGSAVQAQAEASGEELVVADGHAAVWQVLRDGLRKVDPGLRLEGDRFRVRVTLGGVKLAEIHSDAQGLVAVAADGTRARLDGAAAARAAVDRVLRASLARDGVPARPAAAQGVGGAQAGSLRASMAATRISADEHAALDGGRVAPADGSAWVADATGAAVGARGASARSD